MALLLLGSAVPAEGHGTSAKRVEKATVCFAFAYDEDEAMSHVKVTVTAPGGDTPFQTLATDRNGVACFAPDAAGDWRAVANDGMGHQQLMVVPVSADAGNKTPTVVVVQEATPGRDTRGGVLAGIGIIGGLTGLFAWYRWRCRGERGARCP